MDKSFFVVSRAEEKVCIAGIFSREMLKMARVEI